MEKICKICGTYFDTHDRRTATCGDKTCVSKSRGLGNSTKAPTTSKPQPRTFLRKEDLPPVECLPAEYAKAVHDYWLGLTSEAEVIRRVA